jgi:hypothetical protein
MIYSFTAVEVADRKSTGAYCDFSDFQYNSGVEISFTSRWLLTRIQSSATGTTAQLTYTTLPMTASITQKEDSIYAIRDQFQPKRLSTIELKTQKMEVTWANQVITKVKILETVTGNAKLFELYYKTFKDDYYHTTNNAFPAAKTFLYKLREVGANCNPYSSYEFHYSGVNWSREALKKPWKKNNKQDFFGYLTGRDGSYNLPIVHFYDAEPDSRRVRMTTLSGATLSQTLTGYDRTVIADSVKFGALTKVVTPAGGIVEITWEPNEYYDSAVFQNTLGGGARVKKISMSGSDVAYGKSADTHSPSRAVTRSYEYLESNGTTSSGKLLAPLKFGYYTTAGRVRTGTNKGDPSDIMYARVKEIIDTLGYTINLRIQHTGCLSTNSEIRMEGNKESHRPQERHRLRLWELPERLLRLSLRPFNQLRTPPGISQVCVPVLQRWHFGEKARDDRAAVAFLPAGGRQSYPF